jgi:glutamyl-Q tRNA(Asp) synthetase
MGSLFSAVASYLQAKQAKGKWLLRIEDIDTHRTVKGATGHIINDLKLLGFQWDDVITHQNQRLSFYDSVFQALKKTK